MRAVLPMLLALTLPASAGIPPDHQPFPASHVIDQNISLESKGGKRGAWYFSREGHAVFCYGPTVYILAGARLQKVATFCRGDKPVVPLKD